MRKHHHIVVVPGLSDTLYRWMINPWQSKDVTVHPLPVGWKDGGSFESKLQLLVDKIDELASPSTCVSLMGTSAGGSLVVNAFAARQGKIHRVVNVCGRLRAGEGRPSLEKAARDSEAFHRSVLECEQAQAKLNKFMRARILTLRPWWDEVVPGSTVTLEGAENRSIVCVEHSLSIGMAMVVYRSSIMEFIRH